MEQNMFSYFGYFMTSFYGKCKSGSLFRCAFRKKMCPWDDARRDLSSTHGSSSLVTHTIIVYSHARFDEVYYKVWAQNPEVVKLKLFKTFYGAALKLYTPPTAVARCIFDSVTFSLDAIFH